MQLCVQLILFRPEKRLKQMIRKLLRSVREYKLPALMTPLLVFIEVAMEVMIPFIMVDLIDEGIKGQNMSVIITKAAWLLIAGIIALITGAASGKTAAYAAAGFAKNLRQDMFYNIQTFSFANIDKYSSASLVTRLTTDVNNVQMTFQMTTRMAMRSPFMLICSWIMAYNIDKRIALLFLAVIPILFGALYVIMRLAHPTFERVFHMYDGLNRVVEENLRGIRVVKSFVREKGEIEKFDKVNEEIYRGFTKGERTVAFNSPVMQLCMYTSVILVSWLGANSIVAGGNVAPGLTTGGLTSLFTYLTQILTSLMMFSFVFVMYTISKASMVRVTEILDEQSTITNPDSPVTTVEDGSVTFEGVSFRYSEKSEKLCLDGINLTIPSGSTVGILGATGSSKSTLVQLIPRLYDVTEGCVRVGGIDVRKYDLDTLRGEVAMVLQKNVLFSGTIKENLRWGNPDATDEELEHACRLACAHDFISSFPDGYDTYIEQGGTNVSGGQRQRLCIARALLKKPKILILDDSTSAVDTKTDASIRQAFRNSIPDTTKIIIAQRVASVMESDIIIVMDDGKISACGTHGELLTSSELYRDIYEFQFGLTGGASNE